MRLLQTCLDTHPDTIVIMITAPRSTRASKPCAREPGTTCPSRSPARTCQILIGRASHAVVVARESQVLQAPSPANTATVTVTVLGAPGLPARRWRSRAASRRRCVRVHHRESGCGKELIAQFILTTAGAGSRQLVAVNCAALPEPLLESEMSALQGSFTGSVRDKPGLLEPPQAERMLLDELVEMPKSIQAKLLRVIQDGGYACREREDRRYRERALIEHEPKSGEAVAAGLLREDLYYRLRVVPIHMPRWRDRAGDIRLLSSISCRTTGRGTGYRRAAPEVHRRQPAPLRPVPEGQRPGAPELVSTWSCCWSRVRDNAGRHSRVGAP